MEGKLKREVIHVNIELIHLSVQQKLTQHCKVTILKKKKKERKREREKKGRGKALPALAIPHLEFATSVPAWLSQSSIREIK